MARNIEIKARVDDLSALAARVAALATEGPWEQQQDDTFFHCATGRLKLRAFPSGEGELIFYQRDDQPGPKPSFYLRSLTSTPDTLRESLTLAYGQCGRVVKQRTVFQVGRTRVHLDRVQHLGDFVELEVVLADEEALSQGTAEAEKLMERLHLSPTQLVRGAYLDWLPTAATAPPHPHPPTFSEQPTP